MIELVPRDDQISAPEESYDSIRDSAKWESAKCTVTCFVCFILCFHFRII